ncbi:MAG: class I SAM-dependent methyltransferase [Bacteroidia bacterium]|jgi:SAM-dependent methyltransferase
MLVKKEWFKEWFDSPYYQALYCNRDEQEAEYFLNKLVQFLKLEAGKHQIADLACGRGRHSIYLNSLGFDVWGVDLSAQSIRDAKPFENALLQFDVQDLRELKLNRSFDVALNLFTSFGYFRSMEENVTVIQHIHRILKPEGMLVIDFMNSPKVIQHLVERESKSSGGLQFHISKWMENNIICKKIQVDDDDTSYEFTEQVQALTPEDFQSLLTQNGFHVMHTFGNYDLHKFVAADSDRFIILAQKK